MEVPFARPCIGPEEEYEIIDTLRSGWLSTGPKTYKFEQEFAKYLDRRYAVGVTSCTAALHLALLCCGIGPEDSVITPTMTWVAAVNAICFTGAKPVFVDSEPDTGNMSIDQLEEYIDDSTKAIIPVHLYGRPCDMSKLCDLADSYGLKIIGDCAHAVEAKYREIPVGKLGDIACFSFWAAKNLSCGEGGMLVTDNPEYASKANSLRGFGLRGGKRRSDGSYTQTYLGYKYNMFDLQASLGIHQLRKVEARWKIREYLYKRYNELLKGVNSVGTPLIPDKSIRHAYHLYPIIVKGDRNKLAAELKNRGINTSIHFQPVHLEPYYRKMLGYSPGAFPNAEMIGEHVLSLPFWPEMTDQQQDYVVMNLIESLKEG